MVILLLGDAANAQVEDRVMNSEWEKKLLAELKLSASEKCDWGGDDCCGRTWMQGQWLATYRCGEGEGDCDWNSDCLPGLRCGSNNCRGNSALLDSSDDCCVKK